MSADAASVKKDTSVAADSFLSTFTGKSEFVIQAVIVLGLAVLGTLIVYAP